MTMNKQTADGIEWVHVFGPNTGYTWNPIGGCFHDCRWTLPDGLEVQCYAKTFADRARSPKFYPAGFEHHYWHEDRLGDPLKHKNPAGIFLDSMSDVLGHWVPRNQIEQVLDVCRQCPQHIFQLLTKNAPRLKEFEFPENVWVGVSAPPSSFMGKLLTRDQQVRWLQTALRALREVDVPVRWLSAEPLSFDIAPYLADCDLQWAVIGAATNGAKTYQPESKWVENALKTLDRQGVKVFFKGNLKWPADQWREDFPVVATKPPIVQQQSLF